MRICLICSEYPPYPHGGIGSFTHDLATGLAAAGHEVTVAGVYSEAGEATEDGVRVIRLKALSPAWRHRPGALLNRLKLQRTIKRYGPFDIVEVPDYEGWLPTRGGFGTATVVARLHGTNLLFDQEEGRDGDGFEYWLERQTIRSAAAMAAVSQFVLQRTGELVEVGDVPAKVIPCAVDTDLFSPGNVEEEPGLIVFANSLSRKKGVFELMGAMKLVLEQVPQARLVVLGRLKSNLGEGEELKALLLGELPSKWHHRVEFKGYADRATELLDWLRRASVCCYPSHAETFGIAPLEAMAVGKTTLFMENGPGPEVIEHGVSGLLCNTRSSDDIAAKLIAALSDADLRERLGEAARQRAIDLFAKSTWIPRNVAFYEEVCRRDT